LGVGIERHRVQRDAGAPPRPLSASIASVAEAEDCISGGSIALKVPFQLKSLGVTSAGLQSVSVVNLDGQEDRLEATPFCRSWLCDRSRSAEELWTYDDGQHIEVDPISMMTSQPAIYAS